MVSPDLIMSKPPSQEGIHQRSSQGAEEVGDRTNTLIVMLQGEQQVRTPICKDEITIGRSKQNDIQIASEFVSRVHARIVTNDAGTVIEDLNSRNGTRVNLNAVARHTLKHGDVVVLGTTRIKFLASKDNYS